MIAAQKGYIIFSTFSSAHRKCIPVYRKCIPHKTRILTILFYKILSKRSPHQGYVLTKFCKIKSSKFEFYGGCIFYKWGCIFYEQMKKSEKRCLLFEPRSSRCDVQIILDSLAKSRRKFGVRPRNIFFVGNSYFFGEIFAEKKCV